MRLAPRRGEGSWLEQGVSVEGHAIERVIYGHSAAEVRYAVRCPDGATGTLITSLRPYADRHERARFRRLAARRAALDHPFAIPVRAVAEYAGHPVLITDEYPARTFGDLIAAEGPLAPDRVVRLLTPVAEALDRAHAAGLVHDAFSVDSLLLARKNKVLLDSFGLLAVEDEASWSMLEGGDLRYRPPEQVRAEPLSARSNVYSLAAVMVHALTGVAPYGNDRATVMYSHLVDAPPKVSERVPALRPEIDAVVRRAMAKQQFHRPSSASGMVRMAADALGVRSPRRAAKPQPRPRPPADHATNGAGPADVAERRARRGEARERRAKAVARRRVAAAVAVAAACGAIAGVVASPFADDAPAEASRPAQSSALTRLAGDRAQLRQALAAAATPQDQAAAASRLADVYDAAARAGGRGALGRAASDASAAYAALADAASRNDDPGYTEAAAVVDRAEQRVSLAASRH
jgi:hypothetical protein